MDNCANCGHEVRVMLDAAGNTTATRFHFDHAPESIGACKCGCTEPALNPEREAEERRRMNDAESQREKSCGKKQKQLSGDGN